MKRSYIIVAIAVVAIVATYLHWQRPIIRAEHPLNREDPFSVPVIQHSLTPSNVIQLSNELGDNLIDAQDPTFLNHVFPKFREFIAVLNQLGISPFETEIRPSSCSNIRVIDTPNGMVCLFVIGDGWTADYTQNGSFKGITRFGQRGPDNPFRAISNADMETLRRLSQTAIPMPESTAWTFADQVVDAFGIDRSRFEKPQIYEEALFDYHLGMHTVRFRTKGSNPVNQLNYTRSFTLKATSSTTAVLVSYSDLEAR